ncbi:hypothetical protein PL10110_860029 [Planktothrix agardhii]|nr:hypothetical protein PL10110_860029 [Planktothrix agardhii]
MIEKQPSSQSCKNGGKTSQDRGTRDTRFRQRKSPQKSTE